MPMTTTTKLNEILLNVENEASLQKYLQKIPDQNRYESFMSYFLSLEKVKCLDKSDLIARSGLERTYGYHVLNGTKKPSRNKILRFCLAAGLNGIETRKALEAGKQAALYARNQRDAVIAWCIENHKNVMETNELLDDFHMQLLD